MGYAVIYSSFVVIFFFGSILALPKKKGYIWKKKFSLRTEQKKRDLSLDQMPLCLLKKRDQNLDLKPLCLQKNVTRI